MKRKAIAEWQESLKLSVCLCGIIVVMMTVPMPEAFAEMEPALQPPPYRLNRADEDYRYLCDPAGHTDFWDPVKYIRGD